METTEIADSLREAKEEASLDRRVAVYIALLAVLLSICSVGGGNASKDATRTNIQASDTWAFFQAKNQRQTAYKLASDGLKLKALGAKPARCSPQRDRTEARRLSGRSRAPRKRPAKGRRQERAGRKSQGL